MCYTTSKKLSSIKVSSGRAGMWGIVWGLWRSGNHKMTDDERKCTLGGSACAINIRFKDILGVIL